MHPHTLHMLRFCNKCFWEQRSYSFIKKPLNLIPLPSASDRSVPKIAQVSPENSGSPGIAVGYFTRGLDSKLRETFSSEVGKLRTEAESGSQLLLRKNVETARATRKGPKMRPAIRVHRHGRSIYSAAFSPAIVQNCISSPWEGVIASRRSGTVTFKILCMGARFPGIPMNLPRAVQPL